METSKGEKLKRRIFEIIEASREHDVASRAYDIMILFSVIVSMIPLTIKGNNHYTRLIDAITVFIFIFDYVIRLVTSDYKMGVKSYKAYLAYIFTPMAIVDLLSIVPVVNVFLPNVRAISMLRLLRVFRVFKLVRYSKTMVSITNVLRRVKKQLFAVLMLAIIYILVSAMILFQIEPDTFHNFIDAVYWSAMSITTIGYGDIAPISTVGRLFTILSSLVGVAVIALPSGIITAAYMDEIKKKKGKHEL